MIPRPPKAPSYRLHKSTGQAIVTLCGRDCYLGPHGTQASIDKYNQLIAEWQARGGRLPTPDSQLKPLTVSMLIACYWDEFVVGYYVKNGRPTDEQASIKSAMRPLNELYGDLLASDFSPLKLEAVRNKMLQLDWCRNTINGSIHRIRRMFRWAVSRELLNESVHRGLSALRGLAKGRSSARDTQPVRPVPQPYIDAVRPLVSRQVRAMIDLQLLTGMRPGEVCIMRGCDLETNGPTWIYRPPTHKTEHHDKEREIQLGPNSQKIVGEFLKPDTQAALFSPAEAEGERHAEMARQRKTRVQPSQIRRHERAMQRLLRGRRKTSPGTVYTVDAYRRAIARACDEAFPPPGQLARLPKETLDDWQARLTKEQRAQLESWRKTNRWHPNRLRHNAATLLRKQYGIEVARVILGHHSAAVTEVYAEMDRETAAKIMQQVG